MMNTIVVAFFAFLVGTSSSIPVGYDLPYDYYNIYNQPCLRSDLCKALFPFSQIGNVYPSNYLASGAGVGSDLLSPIASDYIYNYPYDPSRTVNFAKENYIRDYGYGQAEYGIRDQVSYRSNVPGIVPPNSRICSYLPIGTCIRGFNRYPTLPLDYAVSF